MPQYFKQVKKNVLLIATLCCLLVYHFTFIVLTTSIRDSQNFSASLIINTFQNTSHVLILLVSGMIMYLGLQEKKPKNSTATQNHTLESLIKESPMPMVKTDANGQIIAANPASEILFNHWKITKQEKLPDDVTKIIQQVMNTHIPQNLLKIIQNKEYSLTIYAQGKHSNIYAHDVTQERQADQMKSEFVSLASHQLRTPLTATRWLIERLAKNTTGMLNAKQVEILDHLKVANIRLITLVNDLLNISRMESGRMAINPQSTQIKPFLESIVNELAPLTQKKQQKIKTTITTSVPQSIMIDPILCEEAIGGLLSNANKYSPKKSTIHIKLTRKVDDYQCSISDQGYGIPEEEKPKIFNRFFRASNVVSQDIEGTGLGLYLIKMIITSWGGTIDFESSSKGTTFIFTIPREGMKAKQGDVTITN